MDIKELQSKTVDWLRFPLIVGVVFIHSIYFAPNAIPFKEIDYYSMSSMDIGSIISAIFSVFIPCVAVPLFFMISGYFFFYKVKDWSKAIYKNKVKSRVKTLFIPYMIWNTLALISIVSLDYITPEREIVGVYNNIFDYIRGYIVHTGFTPYLQPMWFIRDLMVLCVASPILYYLIKKLDYYIMFVFLVMYILFYYLSLHPIFMIFGPSLFYFSFGAYLSISNKNMIEEARKVKWVCGIFCILAFFLNLYFHGSGYWKYISPFYVISGVITTLNIVSYLYEKGKIHLNPFLTKSSFFVFAIHELLLLKGWKMVYIKLVEPVSAAGYIIGYFTVPIMTILSALLIFYLFQTYIPKIANIITGNRG
jgi:surface polysaccharide O-acyltransferase-like enzyme